MDYAECSIEKLKISLDVIGDSGYVSAILNYLLYGIEPGSFFRAMLEDDFKSAILKSHPANTITFMKSCIYLMDGILPCKSCGSKYVVTCWLEMTDDERRKHLEDADLIYTKHEELMKTLREN